MKGSVRLLGGLLVAVAPVAVFSQETSWPTKPIKAIVAFAPGSGTDIVARTVLKGVSANLGQPIIIENRPGAGGTIGAAAVASAPSDGYTLLIHSSSHTVTPATYKNLSYDAERDLTGVIPLASVPMVIISSSEKKYKTLGDLIAKAKAEPDSINYASAGAGGATHLASERLRLAAGYTATHIPTKGSNDALIEVLSGRVDFYSSPIGFALPHLESGRLTALAVTGSNRSSALPDVPTTIEAGFPDSQYDIWIAMFAPANTPSEIIQRLNQEAAKVVETPEVKQQFQSLVMDSMVMTVDEFNGFLKRDFALNAELVKAAGVQPN